MAVLFSAIHVNAFHNPANFSTIKLCVLIKKSIIHEFVLVQFVVFSAQFMLVNIMPKCFGLVVDPHLCVTGRPCGSVAQWSECSHGMREVLNSIPGRAMCFFLPCDIWWLSVGPCSGCEQQRDCLVGSGMVPSRFGNESNSLRKRLRIRSVISVNYHYITVLCPFNL